jgi:phage terminase large subunit-like protein
MAWDLSCPDWEQRLVEGRSLLPTLPLSPNGPKALKIFQALRLPDVPGTPRLRDAAGPWMFDLVSALFGSWDGKERMIREFFAMVPKKNMKTTGGAAIMVTALMMNKRPRAEFLLVAPTLDVADLAFAQAVGMIEADPVLKDLFHIQEHIKRITYRKTKAFLKVKSFDPRIVTGTKPAGILLDELHVIAEAKDADRVIGQLRGGMISQPEGFFITITTQSERPPAGVFRAELMKARAVRDGRLRAPLLPMLYEFPVSMLTSTEPGKEPWRDPRHWHMVTPNNGRSITVDRLVPDFHAAVEAGEGELRRWASQHLNVEIGLALRADAWAGAAYWLQAAVPTFSLEDLIARCDVATVGIDGGGLDDLLGLAVVGRERVTRRWLIWVRAWAHPIVLERRKSEADRLKDFAAGRDLVMVEALGDDVSGVVDVVEQVFQAGILGGIGLDPVGIGDIVDELTQRGISGEVSHGESRQPLIQGIPQGWRLSAAIKTLERALAAGTAVHPGQPMMAWVVSNAKAEPRGNAITITKQASGTAKIDPLVACFNAVELMTRDPKPAGGSVYDERGIVLI